MKKAPARLGIDGRRYSASTAQALADDRARLARMTPEEREAKRLRFKRICIAIRDANPRDRKP